MCAALDKNGNLYKNRMFENIHNAIDDANLKVSQIKELDQRSTSSTVTNTNFTGENDKNLTSLVFDKRICLIFIFRSDKHKRPREEEQKITSYLQTTSPGDYRYHYHDFFPIPWHLERCMHARNALPKNAKIV
jgi:hypothetical protein